MKRLLLILSVMYCSISIGQLPELIYYQFEGSQIANNASSPVGSNPATLVGSNLSLGGSGQFGSALVGQGSLSAEYIQTGWATDLNGDWTISFWLDHNHPVGNPLRYLFGSPAAGNFRCFAGGVAPTNGLSIRGDGITDISIQNTAGTPCVIHVVNDNTAGEVRIYKNGVLESTSSQNINISASSADFTVGGYNGSGGTGSFEGNVDEFRVYDRALGAAEITSTWNINLNNRGYNNAGVSSANSILANCPGPYPVEVEVFNSGVNQIDSVTVEWSIDGVMQTPVKYTGLLDTLGGSGSQTAIVNLGNYTFAANETYDIKAWTINPNGVADTLNDNDTVTDVLFLQSLTGLAVANVTSSSADVSWDTQSGSSYLLKYGETGFDPVTSGTSVTVPGSSVPYTIPGLTASRLYDVYVAEDCGSGNYTSFLGPVSFTTLCSGPLAGGTYTVNSSTPQSATNFASLASLMETLNECGVSGAVTVNIAEGTYNEQIYIGDIPGVSATNTLVLQADPSNTLPVDITYASTGTTDNYVVQFDGSSHVTVRGMTLTATGTDYARVIDFSGGSSHLVVEDNILNGHLSPTGTSTNIAVIMNNTTSSNRLDTSSIRRNEIHGGSYSFYWYGVSTTDMESWNVIDSNIIDGFYYAGLWLYYQENISVRGNKVTGTGLYTTEYGIRHYYNDFLVSTGNRVVVRGTSTNYGYYVYYCDADAATPNLVANNMVSALDNSGTVYGMYVYYNLHTDIVYNSVMVNAGGATGDGLYITGSTATTNGEIRILNNNIVNTGGGQALNTTSGGASGVVRMDYNNWYSTGANLGTWNGSSVTDLAALQSASSMDSNSVSGDPVFRSPDNLNVLGSIANDVALPLSYVTIDIDGQARPATPDMGAIEFTPIEGDLAVVGGEFLKNFPCPNNTDTIALYVKNLIGDTIDFTLNPLTAYYSVTGPVNSSGTFTHNTGKLAPQDTLVLMATNVDLSSLGNYSLEGWIDSNAINLLAFNDTLNPEATIEIDSILKVDPKTHTLEVAGDSVLISARSPFFGGGGSFFMTEIAHYKFTTGQPTSGWPSYLIADDYIEITGVPGSDLGGITLEQWDASSMMSTHTFAPSTFLSPNGTAIIAVGQLAGSVESPSDYYYHGNGSFTGSFSSGGNNGRILKDAGGNIIDAVGVGTTYSFPAAAGVTAADWSGNSGNHSAMSGVRLEGADDNTATNWVISSVSPQDPNQLNSGVILPVSTEGYPGFTWTLNGTIIDSVPGIYVGPFDTPGDYEYIATYVSPCGVTYIDTAIITAPDCALPSKLEVSGITADSANVSWVDAGNATGGTLILGNAGFNPATGGVSYNATSNPLKVTGLSGTTDYEVYFVSDCGIYGYSDTIGPIPFTTPCGALPAPYNEDFEDFTVGFFDGDELCWTVQSNNPGTDGPGGFSWEIRNTPTASTGTGPSGDNTYYPADTGHYFHTDNSGASSADSTILLSPLVNISSLSDPVISFYVHYFSSPTSAYNQRLYVDVYDGNNWVRDVYVLTDPIHTAATDPWTPVYISLAPFSTNDLTRVRFRMYPGTSTGGAGDISVDDVSFDEPPACPNPSNLRLDTITNNTATISFDWIIGKSGSFEYEYGPTGYNVGTGTLGSGGNPLTATGMSQLTTYDMYVRAACSSGSSSWIGPITFTTGCDNTLNGTYTIDGGQPASATNFTSISSAVQAVNLCGVSGPVVFNIKEGNYSEQMDFQGNPEFGNIILGASETNTITFQSDPSNANPPEISYTASDAEDNFVINFNGSSHIKIKGLELTALGTTYARVINFSGVSKGIVIEDNILNGHPSPTTTSTNIAVIMNNSTTTNRLDSSTVKGNVINGGSYSMYWYGISSTDFESGHTIDSNTVNGFYYAGLWLYYQENLKVRGNKVTGGDLYTTEYGIRHYYNDYIVSTGNEVVTYGTSTNYGYYAYYCDATSANPNIVANNMVSGLNNSGTGYSMSIGYCTYTDVVHNSILANAGSATAGHGLYLVGSSAYNDVRIFNNIVVNTGSGVAIEATSAALDMISEIDYNNYYATGSDLANWGGATVGSLTALQSTSSMDSNSISGNPVFLADDDLHVLGGAANNKAIPLAYITTDIDGEARSATTPDIGADEYTPTSSDLTLVDAVFMKNFPCLSASDTIILYVQNLIGDTVDFSVNPLTGYYEVTGPVNSSGTITINTGILAPLDTIELMANNIDLSILGSYNLDVAWIDSSSVNVISMNDSLLNAANIQIDSLLTVHPKARTLEGANDSVLISARSPFFGSGGQFFMTEIAHYKYTVGQPTGGWPSYLIADDYIEITGVPGSDLGGITLEQWDGSSMMSTHTFPPGTFLSPNGTAIIAVGQLAGSVESPSDYYYHGNGSYTGSFSSGGNNGRILKDAGGNIIDAVGVGTSYSFPAAANVTAADWSGNSGNHTTTSGVRLEGPDDNTATNWIVSNVSPQDPNQLNSGVTLPTPEESQPGFTWTLNGTVIDSIRGMYVGPFTNPGDYEYIATFVSPCGITYVDTVVITAPSCPMPGNLVSSSVTANSVDLSWTASSNATSWQVIYDTTGFDPATGGNTVTAGTNPYTLTGLSPNYGYDVYIISDCGSADGESNPFGPISFRTPCTAITGPHLEDFESFTVGFFEGEENCWIVESNNPGTTGPGGFSWEIRNSPQTTSGTGTGPAGDNTYYPADTGHYFHSDNSGGSAGDSTVLISPLFDVSGMNNPELEFFVHYFASVGNYNQKLYVDVYDGVMWHRDLYVLTSPIHSGMTDPWDSVSINLNPYSSTGMVRARFRCYTGTSTGGSGDISLDDISVREGLSCPSPTGFEMIGNGSLSATLGWNAGSLNAVNYVVEYGLPGFTRGTGTKITSSATNVTISSLTTNLAYEAYLKMNCGGGDSSVWVGPVTFGGLSLCDDFESYSAGPVEGYSTLFKGWYGDDYDAVFSTNRSQSGNQSLRIYDSGTEEASDVVAEFDPITSGIWEISFSMYVESGSGGYYNIQQNYDPTGLNNLWAGDVYFNNTGLATVEYGSTTVGTFSYSQGQWIDITTMIDLDNDTIWIELNGTSTGVGWQYSAANGTPMQFNGVNFYSGVITGGTYGIDYYMDDFCVTDASACPAPTNLGATNLLRNSADIYWTSGGATDWNVEYGTQGFSPGSGMMVASTNDTLPLTGLTADMCYDFYVQDNCGIDSSAWTGPYTFCTPSLDCDQAGSDNSGRACDTIMVNLNSYLLGADPGGNWIDADGTGALSGNVFDASQVNFNSTYTFWYVIAETADCPADTAEITIVVDSCMQSLEENWLSRSLSVYPNPTAGEVSISFETGNSNGAELSILDLSGKVIYHETKGNINGSYEGRMSLDKLAKGTYLLQVESGTLKAIRRIVKQ